MYCMNCGKEIGGNIPICGECLQSILDKYKAEQDILTRVNLEAQPFVIDESAMESIPEVSEAVVEVSEELETFLQEGASELPDTPREENDDSDGLLPYFFAICIIVVVAILIIAAF